MRYIPHTEDDIKEMLAAAGISSIEDLFRSIPEDLKLKRKLDLPPALSEQELTRHLTTLGSKNVPASSVLSFLGAGSYQHHIPAAVQEIISRSEWLTPYTPYQPEISQGTLQAIFEYQTMVCNLTGMEVTNASHYDGATATAEAAQMAIGKTRKSEIIVASTLHPEYRCTINTILEPSGKKIIEVPYSKNGRININELKNTINDNTAGVIVQSPNFFGVIEDLEEISAVVKSSGAMFIVAVTEPISWGMLKGPGSFGADIVTAEGQSFGCGLNFGGPYLGIFASRDKYLRSMPGRISGMTTDADGKRGFVLTMSTREQHIRRERATSNICSNEALLATTAAIYLSMLGREGLRKLAEINFSNAEYLKSSLSKIDGIEIKFSAPTFNEFVISVPRNTEEFCESIAQVGIFAGVPLGCWYPELGNSVLVCSTECHFKEDLDKFIDVLKSEA